MNDELLINGIFTSLVKTCDDIYNINLSEYNDRERDLMAFNPKARTRVMRTSDFYKSLEEKFSQVSEVLPPGCRYYRKVGGNHKVVVIEEPPRIRTIKVDTGIEPILEKLKMTGKLKQYGFEDYKQIYKDGYYSFQLSFPYVVFVITLDGRNAMRRLKPFFRLHPITSMTDYLYKAPLYNIPSDQSMCLGNVETGFGSMAENIDRIVEMFWLNIYNHDYSNNIVSYQETDQYEVHDYLSWMHFSQVDPMFIYKIKWIPWVKNIAGVVDEMTRDSTSNDTSNRNMFKVLVDSAFESNSRVIDKSPDDKNMSYSMVVNGDTLSVGDELMFSDKRMYLYSIIGNHNEIKFVELEHEDGSVIEVSLDDFEDDYESLIKPMFIEEAEINGVSVKAGDIVSFKIDQMKMYKKVKNLRKTMDGCVEAFIGSDHYLIENLDFEVINIDHVTINGAKMDEKETYLMLEPSETYGPIFKVVNASFQGISVNQRGEIVLKFSTGDGYTKKVNYDMYQNGTSKYKFMQNGENFEPKACYYFDKLLYNKPSRMRRDNEHVLISKNKGIITHQLNTRGFINDAMRQDANTIINDILIEGGTRFLISGVSEDMDFKVGDPIVYFNWDNPEDMLSVAGIESFTVNDRIVYANAKTLRGDKVFRIPLVNAASGSVNVGVMSKVFSKCGEWSSGDKIKANVAGVYNFPKKDTSTIIAFIQVPNTKYPIALCSNLCTIWMNESTLEQFERIPVNSVRWKRLKDTPFDPVKLRWQHGDLYKHYAVERKMQGHEMDRLTESICFVTKRQGTMNGFDYSYVSSWGHLDTGSIISKRTLEERKIRHGVAMPRIQITKFNHRAHGQGYPNMLGGYLLNGESRLTFKSEQFMEDF